MGGLVGRVAEHERLLGQGESVQGFGRERTGIRAPVEDDGQPLGRHVQHEGDAVGVQTDADRGSRLGRRSHGSNAIDNGWPILRHYC